MRRSGAICVEILVMKGRWVVDIDVREEVRGGDLVGCFVGEGFSYYLCFRGS